jgi:methionine-rich copper-binding protein CopC
VLLDNSCVIRRSVAALVAACLLTSAGAALVLGHANLVESDPADGATLTTTPYTLTATFAEAIDAEASTLFVESASGQQVATGAVNADDATKMTADLPALPDGVYTVRWTTVTPDDNGVERGTFNFTVASGSATPTPTAAPTTGGGSSGNDVVLALVLAAIAIGAVVLFVVFSRGRR